MNVKIYSEDLKAAITKLEKVMSKKPSLPILESVKLFTDTDGIHLIVTNIDSSLIIDIPGHIEMDGMALIDRDNFKLIKRLSGELTIKHDDSSNVVIEGNKKIKYAQLYNVNEFPTEELNINSEAFTIKANEFKESLKVKNMAEKSLGVRPMLNSVNINNNRIMALDGYRLAILELNIHNKYNKDIMIPLDSINQLDKILDKKDNTTLKFEYKTNSDNKATFLKISGNDWQFITKLMDSEYINIDQIIPQEYNIFSKIDSNTAIDTFNFTQEIKNHSMVILDLTTDSINIKKSDETKVIEDRWNINSEFKTDKDNLKIGFNDKYLLDAIKCINRDRIMFKFQDDAIKPLVITDMDNKELHVVLPIRLPA